MEIENSNGKINLVEFISALARKGYSFGVFFSASLRLL